MDKPLSDSTVPLRLAMIQKRFEELMRDEDQGLDALSLEDENERSATPSSRDYFIGR